MNQHPNRPPSSDSESVPHPTPYPHDALHNGNWKTSRKLRRKEHHDIMHRMNTKVLAVRISIVTSLLFLLTAALSVLLYLQMIQAEDQYNQEKSEANHKYNVMDAERTDALTRLADLQASRDVLISRLEDALEQIEALTEEKNALLADNELVTSLNNTITTLRAQIASLEKQIEDLRLELMPDSPVNLQTMLEALTELKQLLEFGAPKHTVAVKKYDEYGVIYYEEELVYPNLSVYVYSPKTGVSYEWGIDTTYEIGDLKHLILALALFECATDELRTLSIAEGTAADLVYDLSDTYILKEEDIVADSGILKNATPGTEYTYLELIKIMLSYCDYTAYSQLIARFGTDPINLLLLKIEGLSNQKSIERMSAADMMLILRRVYSMISANTSPYAADFASALTSAVSTNYSQCLPGVDIARQHTLTRTVFHEVGIRLDGSDYLVLVMSDIPSAGADAFAFLQTLYQQLISIYKQLP